MSFNNFGSIRVSRNWNYSASLIPIDADLIKLVFFSQAIHYLLIGFADGQSIGFIETWYSKNSKLIIVPKLESGLRLRLAVRLIRDFTDRTYTCNLYYIKKL